jgi:hypothetical protein
MLKQLTTIAEAEAKEKKQDYKVIVKKDGKKITSIASFPASWTSSQIKEWYKTDVLELTKITKVKEEEQVIPQPENEMTPKQEMRYADDLASRLPKDLTTEEEILAAGFKLAEKDIGRRSAVYYFQYDEDFASDFVSAYKEATPLGALSGQTYESLGQAFMKKHLAQEGVVDTIKKGIKSVKRGMAGWDKEAEGPGGEKPADPKDIVKRNKGYDDETVQRLAKTGDFGFPFGKDAKAGDKTPRGLQRKVLDREMKKRGLTSEAKDDSYYTTSSSKATELMKERFGPTTKSTDKDGRWIFKDKDGVQVALSDIDGEGDRTWNIFKSKTVKEEALKEWGLTYDNKDWKKNITPAQLEKEIIAYLKKKGGKMWFKGDDYSYLMDVTKPTTLVATDGSVIKVKKLIDVEKYVNKNDFADFAESDPLDWDDFFRAVKKGRDNNQAEHEAKNRVGESLIRDMMKMIPRGILGEEGEPFWQQLMRAAHTEDDKKGEFSKAFAYDIDGVARAFKKSFEEGMKEWKDMRLAYKNHLKQVYGITAPTKVAEEVDMEAVRALSDDKLKEMIKDFESQLKMGDSNATSGLKALKAEAKRRDSAGYVEEAAEESDPKAKALGKYVYYTYTAKGKKEPKNPYPKGSKSNKDYEEGYEKAWDDQDRRNLAASQQYLVMAYDVKDRLTLLKQPSEYVGEAATPTYKGYDVSHMPDGVMVLVMGSEMSSNFDDYNGVNVVFGKPGTEPELVTADKWGDIEVKKHKKEIIAAAEKRLGKEEKDHLASL